MYVIDKLATGGAQQHLIQLIRCIDKSRFRVSVCTLMEFGDLFPELPDVKIDSFCLGIRRINDFKGVKAGIRLARLIMRQRPHIVHTYLFSAHILGTLAARAASTPIIIAGRRQLIFWQQRRHIAARRIVNPFVHLSIANSKAVADHVMRTERVAPNTVVVIPNGVNTERFHPLTAGRSRLRDELALSRKGLLVGTVASLTPVKNHQLLLTAASLVRTQVKEVRFLIVGDGPLKAELMQTANSLGLGENVVFMGRRRDTAKILQCLDLFILPSRSEGMSNAILEAMACGLPVVAMRTGGNVEVIRHQETGLLVTQENADRLAQAIISLLTERDIRRRMGQNARELILRRFSLESMVQRHEEVYAKLVHGELAHG